MPSYTGFDVTRRKPMSDLQAIADRVEIEALPRYRSAEPPGWDHLRPAVTGPRLQQASE
jgi:hypothetical protein